MIVGMQHICRVSPLSCLKNTTEDTPEEIRLNHNYWENSNWVAATENVNQRYESSQEQMQAINSH